jgi:hypothetical protein
MLAVAPAKLALEFGIFAFISPQLISWRSSIDGAMGDNLVGIVAASDRNGLRVNAPELKRVPSPYAPYHRRATLLRRKGWRYGTTIAA